MDWTTLGSVLGSNFFIAVVSLATARWQINNAKEQLDRQLQSERERGRRERRWEIRGEPLRKLRGGLAYFGAKTAILTVLRTTPKYSEEYEKVSSEIWEYIIGAEFKQTLYSLDEPKIIELVKELFRDWAARPLPSDGPGLTTLIQNMDKKVLQIQALINERLEEL